MNESTNAYEGGSSKDPSVSSNPYSAASAGALADLQAPAKTVVPEEPAAAVAAVADPEVVLETPVPEAKAETPAADEGNDLKFELKVKGQTQVLTRDELIEMAQKGVDYTQKTQKVAESERQVLAAAQLLQQREKDIAEFLQDPAKVQAWINERKGQVDPGLDPADIPTQAQVMAQLKQLQADTQRQLDKKAEEVENRINTRLFEAEVAEKRTVYDADITKTIAGLAEKFPALDTYDAKDLDRVLRADIAEKVAAKIAAFPDREVTIAEVKTLLVEAAKGRADRADAKIQNHLKMAKVREAKLQTTGIEPQGGAPATPIAAAPAKQPKLGSKELMDSVLADINAAMKKG